MKARRLLLPLALLLYASIPVTPLAASPSGTWTEYVKLTASDAEIDDWFGESVAVSDGTAIVGAHNDWVEGFPIGSAYLFDVTTGNQLFRLNADDAEKNEFFGQSVAISGNTAIVGAYWDYDVDMRSGSAYVFDVATGNQLLKLKAEDPGHTDYFGWSIDISGNTAIIGAMANDDAGDESGSAYLFDVTTGNQLLKLSASDAEAWDFFGYSVAISGNVAIVGATGDDAAGERAGSAYLFDVTTGEQLFKLTPNDAMVQQRFGNSVDISGNTAIVGAFYDHSAGTRTGSAYLFDVTTGNQLFKLTASDPAEYDEFGVSVGISGNVAVVGAHDETGRVSGSANLFDVTTGEEISELAASDAAAGDMFGYSVDISGDVAIVGAYREDHAGKNSGSAYVFIIPEPSSLILLLTGALGLLLHGWRRRK